MLCFFDLWSICKVKYDENVKSKFCHSFGYTDIEMTDGRRKELL